MVLPGPGYVLPLFTGTTHPRLNYLSIKCVKLAGCKESEYFFSKTSYRQLGLSSLVVFICYMLLFRGQPRLLKRLLDQINLYCPKRNISAPHLTKRPHQSEWRMGVGRLSGASNGNWVPSGRCLGFAFPGSEFQINPREIQAQSTYQMLSRVESYLQIKTSTERIMEYFTLNGNDCRTSSDLDLWSIEKWK